MRELRSLAPAMHSTIPSIIAASERGVCGSGKFYNLFQTLRMAAFGGRPRRVGVALAAAVAAAASGGRFARAFVVAGGGGRVGGQAALRMAPESDTRGLVQPPEFPTSGAVDADEESYWSAIFSSGLEGEVSMVDAFSCPSTQVLEFLVRPRCFARLRVADMRERFVPLTISPSDLLLLRYRARVTTRRCARTLHGCLSSLPLNFWLCHTM
jgi:hypothetical protein